MTLSAALLEPLVANAFVREYNLVRPLKYIATKYTLPNASGGKKPPVSIVLVPGTGCTGDLWVPALKHLFALANAPESAIRLLSVWIVDRPNHGDAALLNAKALAEHYTTLFSNAEYGAAVSELVGSGLLTSEDRDNLVALSHSGAGAALIDAIPVGTHGPFRSIVFIEPIFLERDPKITKVFDMVHKLVAQADAKVPKSWPSVEAGTTYLCKRMPFRAFDADNRRIIAETFFTPAPGGGGAVTTKTPAMQRAASFGVLESGYANTERVVQMLSDSRVGFHAIRAGVEDLWPPPMADAIRDKTDKLAALGVGVTVVEDVGHHLPHEQPEVCAKVILDALVSLSAKSVAQPKL